MTFTENPEKLVLVCKFCGQSFQRKRIHQKFCKQDCKIDFYNKRASEYKRIALEQIAKEKNHDAIS